MHRRNAPEFANLPAQPHSSGTPTLAGRPPRRFKNVLRRIRRGLHQVMGREIAWPTTVNRPTLHVGTEYGGWAVLPDLLPPSPSVFSIGVGSDITFDLEMIRRFDATVYGFDPTPKAMNWIKTQEVPPGFHFVPIGLADFDGTQDFGLNRPDWDSYSVLLPVDKSVERAVCRVARLKTLASEVDVHKIDVLKVDIEGSEYTALPDALNSGFVFSQLLLELHYDGQKKAELDQARALLRFIQDKGYQLFRRTPVGKEFSFVHESMLKSPEYRVSPSDLRPKATTGVEES